MRLRFSSFVKYDLAEIAEYIARDSPRYAAKVIGQLRQGMKDAAGKPKLYRVRPEIGPEARMLSVGSYIIIFRLIEGFVRIERIMHGSRDLSGVLEGDDNA